MGQDQRERFLVVGAGRTGSSLLCAVLAAAGADFGMPADQVWAADDGAFEHADVTRAAAWFTVADRLGAVRPLWPRRWIWDAARHHAKMHLRHALAAAQFVKGPNLDLTVQLTAKFGYLPRIVVSHRSFAPQAMSLALRAAGLDTRAIEAYYLRTYKNALLWLHVYGGCTVDFDDLIDPQKTQWLDAVAEVTGLSRRRMAAARAARLDPGRAPRHSPPVLSPECERLHACLCDLRGQVVLPSRLAARAPALRLASRQAA
ncbi:MAG TPA: hypothetical protein VMF86_12735 [Stellaceae bacterium]|nr:hypothetical protein [Stellaceae bacterium]